MLTSLLMLYMNCTDLFFLLQLQRYSLLFYKYPSMLHPLLRPCLLNGNRIEGKWNKEKRKKGNAITLTD